MLDSRLKFALSVAHGNVKIKLALFDRLHEVLALTRHSWMLVSDLSGHLIVHEKGFATYGVRANPVLLPVSTDERDADSALVVPLHPLQMITQLNRCGLILEDRLFELPMTNSQINRWAERWADSSVSLWDGATHNETEAQANPPATQQQGENDQKPN